MIDGSDVHPMTFNRAVPILPTARIGTASELHQRTILSDGACTALLRRESLTHNMEMQYDRCAQAMCMKTAA